MSSPDKSVTAEFDLHTLHFSFADADGRRTTQCGDWKLWIGPRGEGRAEVVSLR
jgi:hypothetical protein